MPVLAAGPFQRRNFALARAAAEAFLGELDDAARARRRRRAPPFPAASRSSAQDPVTIFDGAHNADGMRSLAAALREMLAGRPLVAVLSVLDDKDAAAMLARARAAAARSWSSRAPANPRDAPAGDARVARRASWGRAAEPGSSPSRTPRWRAARAAAGPGRRRARDRLALPPRRPAARARSAGVDAVNDDGGGPSVLAMVLAVAAIVALVILVFFALGYAFGRIFL